MRIGVHVGEVIVEPERLTGEAVNIAARIESFAVPGGVMLSDSAYEQITNRTDVGVVALGRFKLKNVGRPFELYAVSADGLVVPDPSALEGKGERIAGLPSNLPTPATPLLGRAPDLDTLVELIRTQRVVTITGPGGVGKTRILVELGGLLAPEFLDGVAFVALADVTDPADFFPSLAGALDVKEAEERTLGTGSSLSSATGRRSSSWTTSSRSSPQRRRSPDWSSAVRSSGSSSRAERRSGSPTSASTSSCRSRSRRPRSRPKPS